MVTIGLTFQFMSLSSLSEFRLWLAAQNRWSTKAQNDLVSRLKRADKILAVDAATSSGEYLKSLKNSVEIADIPRSSRTGMYAAASLYFEWKTSR